MRPSEFAQRKIRAMWNQERTLYAGVLSAGQRVRELVAERQAREQRERYLQHDMRLYDLSEADIRMAAAELNGEPITREQMSQANRQRARILHQARAAVQEITAEIESADEHRVSLEREWQNLRAVVERLAPKGPTSWEMQGPMQEVGE